MAYSTWDWSKVTGVGATCSIDTERLSPALSDEVQAGYITTAPAFSKDFWLFKINFKVIRSPGYIYLVDFFHSHRGGQLFYFKLPFGLYGIPLEFYTADPGGVSPWSSEKEIGYGEPPTYLVRFMNQSLPITRRDDTAQNYWFSSSPIELRQS